MSQRALSIISVALALPIGAGGVEVTQTAPAAAIYNPSWAPDGRLLYESDEGGRYALWVVNIDGSSRQRFLPVDFEHQQPVVSPDGKSVAFVANGGATGNDIFVVSVDGSGRRTVTNASGSQYLPRWSTDGRSVLYISDVSGTRERDLVVSNVATGQATNVTNTPDRTEANAAWAPGPKILFSSRQGDESNVFSMNADGSDRRQLTHGVQAGSLSWAPNGSITFTSRKDGQSSIYLMAGDGSNLRQLTSDAETISNAVWSRDGTRLAFIVSSSGRSSLYVSNPSGSDRVCVLGACKSR